MMNGKNWNGWGVSEIGPLHIKENLPKTHKPEIQHRIRGEYIGGNPSR